MRKVSPERIAVAEDRYLNLRKAADVSLVSTRTPINLTPMEYRVAFTLRVNGEVRGDMRQESAHLRDLRFVTSTTTIMPNQLFYRLDSLDGCHTPNETQDQRPLARARLAAGLMWESPKAGTRSGQRFAASPG